MRIVTFTLGLTAVTALAASPLAAQGHSGKTPTTPHATTVQTHGNPHTTTTTAATSGKKTTRSTAPVTTITPLNPVAQKIYSHPQLVSKLTPMLPKGMTLNQASAGFKNQGQFIAALHVSQNLGIPFKDLRTQMVKQNMSLGQSIQTLKKSADAGPAVITAEHEADADVKSTLPGSTTTTKKKGGK